MTQLNGLNSLVPPVNPSATAGVSGPQQAGGDGDFARVLLDSISEVNRLQNEASDATARLASGQSNVAEVMVAVQKADLAYSMLMEIKNKLMDAYQEIQQMRI